MKREPRLLSRRAALAGSGATLAATLLPRPAAAAAAPLALTATTTEGPYYFDAGRERSDIREGLAGVPLELQFTVTDQAGRALPGLRVDVWHCDAQGRYSGFAHPGQAPRTDETFLRGSQGTDAGGRAGFRTVYPGWYEGRTTHIHLKVIADGHAVLTTQFFLPDALSEFLYTQLPAYQRAQLRDTLNSADGIALRAGDTVLGAVRDHGDRYVASLALVVDPAARPAVERPPMPGGMRPDGMPPGDMPPGGMPAGPPPGGPLGRFAPPPRPQALQGEARLAALVPHARSQP